MTKRVTVILMLFTIAVLVVWDIVPAITQEKGDTISEVTLMTALDYRAVPYALGVIMGHFFWPLESSKDWSRLRYWSLFTVAVSLMLVMFALPSLASALFPHPALAAIVGFVLGHFLWPQSVQAIKEGSPKEDHDG